MTVDEMFEDLEKNIDEVDYYITRIDPTDPRADIEDAVGEVEYYFRQVKEEVGYIKDTIKDSQLNPEGDPAFDRLRDRVYGLMLKIENNELSKQEQLDYLGELIK